MCFEKTKCDRCGADLAAGAIMSKFNFDMLCGPCKTREKAHPDYERADAEEIAAVRAGVRNFPGIGCPTELYDTETQADRALIAASPLDQAAFQQTLGAQPNTTRTRDGDAMRYVTVFADNSVLTVRFAHGSAKAAVQRRAG